MLSHLHRVECDLEFWGVSQNKGKTVSGWLPRKCCNGLLLLHGLYRDKRFSDAENLKVVVLHANGGSTDVESSEQS